MLVAAAIGVGSALASYHFAHRFDAITVRWTVTTYDGEGKIVDGPRLAYRVSSTTGRWQQVVETKSGKHQIFLSEPGQGVFGKAPGGDRRVSDTAISPEPSDWSYWRNQPEYQRDDTVMGIPVVVLKMGEESEGTIVDEYRAPDYHGAYIKMVVHHEDNLIVYEPVSVTLGEPSPADFKYQLQR